MVTACISICNHYYKTSIMHIILDVDEIVCLTVCSLKVRGRMSAVVFAFSGLFVQLAILTYIFYRLVLYVSIEVDFSLRIPISRVGRPGGRPGRLVAARNSPVAFQQLVQQTGKVTAEYQQHAHHKHSTHQNFAGRHVVVVLLVVIFTVTCANDQTRTFRDWSSSSPCQDPVCFHSLLMDESESGEVKKPPQWR